MNKIQKVSLFFRIFFQIIFVALPILLMITWMYAPQTLILFHGIVRMSAIPESYSSMHVYSPLGLPASVIMHTLTAPEKILGFTASLLPLAVKLFILYSLIKLFRLYEKGEIFSLRHVKYIRDIGFALLIGQILNPFYQLLMGIILTLKNPPGFRFIAVSLDQTNIGILLTSLLVILISWIMAEGYKLREEQQLTI